PFSASWDATTVSSGSYDLQPVITDSAGNTFTGAMRTITVDVSAPTVVLTNPGATISGSVTLDATVGGSGATQVVFATSPAGVTLDGSATVAPVVSGTHIDYGTGALAPGPHTLAGELQDSSGKKAPFRVHFTVWTASSSVAPAVDKNTSAGSATTVESADG